VFAAGQVRQAHRRVYLPDEEPDLGGTGWGIDPSVQVLATTDA
jgi:hypothetical protein